MKQNIKRLLSVLLIIMLCLCLLPGTALAANIPNGFYASITPNGFGTINNSNLNYNEIGADVDRVIYGMESAGGVFFTVEGNVINGGKGDDGWRELRMYNSSLTNYRTIGTVNQESGNYWIIDTAMNTSGEVPKLYGTYNYVIPEYSLAQSMICTVNLETAATGNYLTVSELPDMHIIYAIAFDNNGTMYAIGADAGDNGGPASLYTINLQTGDATLVGAIKDASNQAISTNYCQDIAFDLDANTLYWAENNGQKIYKVSTTNAVATEVGTVKYKNAENPLQNICVADDTAFADNKYIISVFHEGAGTVTCNEQDKAFYTVSNGNNITLDITPDEGGGLKSVKVDGESISLNDLTAYTLSNVTQNHVIEVEFKKEIPVEKITWDWSHYNGKPASYYTQNVTYKFYRLPSSDTNAPKNGYTQTLLDESGKPIANDEVIIPGNYDVRITHPGNDDYATLDTIYEDALQLAKCNGTPGRPVVYGKVGCKQSDLATTSYLYGWNDDNSEIIPVYDLIPVTLEWQNPDNVYSATGTFTENPKIYAANELDERLLKCYDLDVNNTIPLTAGCEIEPRSSRVVVLPENEASIIKLLNSNESGGTVSGQGVYKNGNNVTVTATANEGYTFKGWQENGNIVSNDDTYTFEANGDRTLNAIWKTTTTEKYSVNITAGEGMRTIGNANQTEIIGAMTEVVYTADDTHYFPEDYGVNSVNGISVIRKSYTEIKVSGTPTANTTITLRDATEKDDINAPDDFEIEDTTHNTITVKKASDGWEYSRDDGVTWQNSNVFTGLTPSTTYKVTVRVKETETTKESEMVKAKDITTDAAPYIGGGSYIPPSPPEVKVNGTGGEATLDADKKGATIIPDEGYVVKDVTLNGVSIGAVTEVTGLKAGDKVVVTFEKKAEEPVEPVLDEVKELIKEFKFKASTKYTSKKNVKVTAKVLDGDISAITDMGYRVEYTFSRAEKKGGIYYKKKTSEDKTYINTAGKKGKKYYYRVQMYVYDGDTLVGKTEMKQSEYGVRTWKKK